MSGAVGAKALYFLFAWLISAAAAAWLSERKGYGDRVGLTFGLILSLLGLLIVALLPAGPGRSGGSMAGGRGGGGSGRRWRPEGTAGIQIVVDDLSGPLVAAFLAEHVRDMRAITPLESKHALDLDVLRRPRGHVLVGA